MNKICLLFYGSLKAPTGASSVLRNILEGFKESKKYSLDIYCLDSNDFNEEEFQNSSVRKTHLKTTIIQVVHSFLSYSSKYSLLITKFYVWLQYHKNAMQVLKDNIHKIDINSDILFFHDIITPYHLKKTEKKLWDSKKKVLVLHSNGEVFKMLFLYYPKLKSNKKSKSFYEDKIAINTLKDIDKIVLLSEFSKKMFLNIYPYFESKVEVVANGINYIESSEKDLKVDSKFIFTSVGTVGFRKGHDVIIDAVSLIEKDLRDLFTINIIGDGDILDALKRKCIDRDITNIIFFGNRKDVKNFLSESDCFLLASRDEGLPIAIIEAMAMNLPIIGTEVGGVPDLVKNNHNGFLIKPNNKFELKEAIEKMLKMSRVEVEEFGKNSYLSYNSDYKVDNMINKYVKIFDSLE